MIGAQSLGYSTSKNATLYISVAKLAGHADRRISFGAHIPFFSISPFNGALHLAFVQKIYRGGVRKPFENKVTTSSVTMVTHWASSLRAGWLFSAYDEDGDDGIRKIPDESVELQLLNALEDLLLARVSPKDSAAKTAYLIMSEEDIDQWWYSLWTMYFDAVEKLEDEKHSKALVDYVVELASLPDAVNEGPGTKTIEECGGKKVRIEAGQTVVFEGWGTLWRDLPQFSIYFTDTLQGEEFLVRLLRFPVSDHDCPRT